MVNSGAPKCDSNSSFKSTYSSFHIFSAILRGTGGKFPPTTMASDDGSWGGAGMTDATALLGGSVPPVVLAVGGAVLALGSWLPPGELNTGSGMILAASPPTGSPTLPVLVRNIPLVVELLDPCVAPATAVYGAADILGESWSHYRSRWLILSSSVVTSSLTAVLIAASTAAVITDRITPIGPSFASLGPGSWLTFGFSLGADMGKPDCCCFLASQCFS